ncbi:hypothetical protein [Clostridium sp.]|uniref:hypothetical protein n=1 Tax=Clostridium sp. TaxID=1506 RepID=UPI002FC757FE
MKVWEEPKLYTLGIKNTFDYDSSSSHYCHSQNANCTDFTDGSHNSMGDPHPAPSWNECVGFENSGTTGHTCCCPMSIS